MAWGKPQALEEEENGGGWVTKVINAAIARISHRFLLNGFK